jgi:hypothetical protein
MAAAKSFWFSINSFIASGMESDRHNFPGFVQVEARLLNFSGDSRHVGRSPGHDDVVRLRKPGMDFFQEMPIALPEEIIKELLLKMGRLRELRQLQHGLGVHTLCMNEHD